MQNCVTFNRDKGIDPQTASPLVRLPPEIHLTIAMESDSDEAIFALLRTCKTLYGVYRDLLYERNIRHDDGSAVFKIARNGQVAAFENLERVAKTMEEGMPALNRVQFISPEGQTVIGSSLSDSASCPFIPENSFTPLHWAAAGGIRTPSNGSSPRERLARLSANHWKTTVCAGHVEASRRLLLAEPSAFDYPQKEFNPTMFDVAVIYGHVYMIRFLIQSGHPCLTINTLEYAALSKSIRTSLRCLAALGQDIFMALDKFIRVQFPDIEAMQLIQDPAMRIDLGRPAPNDPSTNQATALLAVALSRGWVVAEKRDELRQLVIFLIQSGADVNYHSTTLLGGWHGTCVLEAALYINYEDGSVAEELVNRGARVHRGDGEESLAILYLSRMRRDPDRVRDFDIIRADGSCAAVHKLELLLKHGAVLDQNCGFQPLEDAYLIATTGQWSYNAAGELSFLKVLVKNGVTRDPAGGNYQPHSYSYLFNIIFQRHTNRDYMVPPYNMDHSFLYRALTSGHYDIARVFIERGGTCFGVHDRMEDIDGHHDQMPKDIREWIDSIYFL
ncbi:ankyrin repeat-containing protein [Apiospora hydei]|uniref:Ankyrin repeat-containing protein n=1 Tax=Apiospora hydei TaxID=1337664 RepID=A0ABR1WLR4_9PEZI